MIKYTPPQIRALEHMRKTRQSINLDAKGMAFMIDGTQVNKLTLRALLKKHALRACGTDLLGDGVAAYEISDEARRE